MAHTKGPWRAINLNWGMQILPPQGYGKISVIAALGDDEKAGPHRTKEVKANAQLIAAAPNLLEACEAIHEWLGTDDAAQALPFEPPWYQQLRDAIKKARGEVSND